MPVIAPSQLLKSEALPQRMGPVSFAYTDLETQCDEQLLAAQQQARQLILDAELRAEQLRNEAQQIGHATGSLRAEIEFGAAVEIEVQRRVAQQLDQLVPALESATAQLIRDREQALLQSESAVIRLSLKLAERILRRELETKPSAPRALVAEALQLTAEASSIMLRLHPHDVCEIEAHSTEWQQLLETRPGLKIVADSQISRGGCMIETAAGEIDGRIESQLARIAAELLGDGT